MTLGQTCALEEAVPYRARRRGLAIVLKHIVDYRVAGDCAATCQLLNKCFDTLIVRVFPGGVIQPEGTAGRAGELRLNVEMVAGRHARHERAQLELDPDNLRVRAPHRNA